MNSNAAPIRYSLRSPLFYRFKFGNSVCGLGTSTIPSDPGLWNLAWLTYPASMFRLYESGDTPVDHLPMWDQFLVQPIFEIGRVEISDRPLREWAAELSACNLIKLVAENIPTSSFPLKKTSWAGWLSHASMRANTSSDDTAVLLCEYPEPDTESQKLSSIEESYVRTLPRPALPVYKRRRSSKAFDLAR